MQPFEAFTIYNRSDFDWLTRTPAIEQLLLLLQKASLTHSPIQQHTINECLCCGGLIAKLQLCYLTQPWQTLYAVPILGQNTLAVKWFTCEQCVIKGKFPHIVFM